MNIHSHFSMWLKSVTLIFSWSPFPGLQTCLSFTFLLLSFAPFSFLPPFFFFLTSLKLYLLFLMCSGFTCTHGALVGQCIKGTNQCRCTKLLISFNLLGFIWWFNGAPNSEGQKPRDFKCINSSSEHQRTGVHNPRALIQLSFKSAPNTLLMKTLSSALPKESACQNLCCLLQCFLLHFSWVPLCRVVNLEAIWGTCVSASRWRIAEDPFSTPVLVPIKDLVDPFGMCQSCDRRYQDHYLGHLTEESSKSAYPVESLPHLKSLMGHLAWDSCFGVSI